MEVVLSKEKIAKRIEELGLEISAAYSREGVRHLVVIGVLRGAFIFLSDLVRKLSVPIELDFVWASSYGEGTTSKGSVSLVRDLQIDIRGAHVLIVEDIVDTGITMDFMLTHLKSKGPASLSVCSLLHKPARTQKEVPIRFLGFTIEDQFVVGYGLDFNNKHREYADIVILPKDKR